MTFIIFGFIAALLGCTSATTRPVESVDRTVASNSVMIWRDRPAFSPQAYELLAKYKANGFYENDSKQLQSACPLAHRYIANMLEKLAIKNQMTDFLHSSEGPKALVFCSSNIGDSLTKIDGTIYIGGADILSSRTDDEIAFVLAHEFAHVTLGHLELEVARLRGYEISDSSPTTITQEWEADMSGMEIMRNAGFDDSAAYDSLRTRRKAKDSFFLGMDISPKSPFAIRENRIKKAIKASGTTSVVRTVSPELREVWKELHASSK